MIRTLKAFPTMLRVGVAETVAYRAEFLVWILTTTMPLIMLGLWSSVASEGAFANYSSADFVAYYLGTLIVRNLTSNWVGWQISEDVRSGTLAMRLLRPVHPFFQYAATHIAALPLRGIVTIPIAFALLFSSGASAVTADPAQLALFVPAVALAWIIAFSVQFSLGALAFHITKISALTNLYFGAFVPLSGYLMPLPLMKPSWIPAIAHYTPFPSMLFAPVTILTRALAGDELRDLLLAQLGWAAGTTVLALALWRAGVRRFEAVGS